MSLRYPPEDDGLGCIRGCINALPLALVLWAIVLAVVLSYGLAVLSP